MDEEEFKELQSLHTAYTDFLAVCDPVTYDSRRQTLIHALADAVLVRLYQEDKRRRESSV